VLAGLGQSLDDARPFGLFKTVEFGFEPAQALFRHWEFVHVVVKLSQKK
jgi:hypothetical protein